LGNYIVIVNNPISIPAAITPYEIILLLFSLLLLSLLPLPFLLLPFPLLRLRLRHLLLGPSDRGVTVWLVNYDTYEYISFRSFRSFHSFSSSSSSILLISASALLNRTRYIRYLNVDLYFYAIFRISNLFLNEIKIS
jgi:hypothetical protein